MVPVLLLSLVRWSLDEPSGDSDGDILQSALFVTVVRRGESDVHQDNEMSM